MPDNTSICFSKSSFIRCLLRFLVNIIEIVGHQNKFSLLSPLSQKIKEISFSTEPILYFSTHVCIDFSVENLENLVSYCFNSGDCSDKSPHGDFLNWIIDFSVEYKSMFHTSISKLSTLMSIYNRGKFRLNIPGFFSLKDFRSKIIYKPIQCDTNESIQKSRIWITFKECNSDDFFSAVKDLVVMHGCFLS
jgi:hypothetical protein